MIVYKLHYTHNYIPPPFLPLPYPPLIRLIKTLNLRILSNYVQIWVLMVLNPIGIEPTFLKLVVAGGGFYSYYNLQYIKFDKEKKNSRKKSVLCIKNI